MGKPAGSLMDLPELPGWLTFGEAADRMKVSIERIRQLATSGKLRTARRLGQRPIGIVREAEVNEAVARRAATGSFFADTLPPRPARAR